MRDYLESGEPVAQKNGRDTEVTLGSGALLAICGGLILLCGLFFGLGYTMGRHAAGPKSASSGPTAASDAEPLQASGAIPKPAAAEQAPVAAQHAPDSSADNDADPTAASTPQNLAGQNGAPATGSAETAQSNPSLRPAIPQSTTLMVQVASIANPEDADVLAGALRKRGYSVMSRREPVDNLIHVRIGPFTSHEVAEQWRQKLQKDGYNAVIQP